MNENIPCEIVGTGATNESSTSRSRSVSNTPTLQKHKYPNPNRSTIRIHIKNTHRRERSNSGSRLMAASTKPRSPTFATAAHAHDRANLGTTNENSLMHRELAQARTQQVHRLQQQNSNKSSCKLQRRLDDEDTTDTDADAARREPHSPVKKIPVEMSTSAEADGIMNVHTMTTPSVSMTEIDMGANQGTEKLYPRNRLEMKKKKRIRLKKMGMNNSNDKDKILMISSSSSFSPSQKTNGDAKHEGEKYSEPLPSGIESATRHVSTPESTSASTSMSKPEKRVSLTRITIKTSLSRDSLRDMNHTNASTGKHKSTNTGCTTYTNTTTAITTSPNVSVDAGTKSSTQPETGAGTGTGATSMGTIKVMANLNAASNFTTATYMGIDDNDIETASESTHTITSATATTTTVNGTNKSDPNHTNRKDNKNKMEENERKKPQQQKAKEKPQLSLWDLHQMAGYGGNIAEKVKLSRRRAASRQSDGTFSSSSTSSKVTTSRNTNATSKGIKRKSPVKSTLGLKPIAEEKAKVRKKKLKLSSPSALSPDKGDPKKKKKHPLRISLKMNLGKNKKLKNSEVKRPITPKSRCDRSGNGAATVGSVEQVGGEAFPKVVQIRRKKKAKIVRAKKRKREYNMSEEDDSSSDDSSSSGSESDDSASSSSESDSSSSDGGSSSDSSSSSSSGSSSSSSDESSDSDDSDDSDNESSSDDDDGRGVSFSDCHRKKHKKSPPLEKIKVATMAAKPNKLKVRGRQKQRPSVAETHKVRKESLDDPEKIEEKNCQGFAETACPMAPTVRALTASEVRAILAEDDINNGGSSSFSWVRRSTRQPSRSAVTAPNVRAIVQKLEMDDPDMVVLKCKKYLSDPDTPSVIVDAMLDALEGNTNCQALYIQNFNQGMKDDQVLHLLRILQQPSCKIWCLNIGETYNVKRRTWAQFTSGLKKTKITHMYASEHTISSAMKEKIRETIRNNRKKHDMHINPDNLDVIVQCTHCWWNPINARVLQPFVKQRGYEYILFDKVAQGAKDVVTDKNRI